MDKAQQRQLAAQWRTAHQEISKIWQEFERLESEGRVRIIGDEVIFLEPSDYKRAIGCHVKTPKGVHFISLTGERDAIPLSHEGRRFTAVDFELLAAPVLVDDGTPVKKPKSYGPPRTGKRGKVRRW